MATTDPADHTPAEAGTDPRVDILAQSVHPGSVWPEDSGHGAQALGRAWARAVLAQLDEDAVHRVADVLVEAYGGDSPEGAIVTARRALAAAGLLATDGTEGEAEAARFVHEMDHPHVFTPAASPQGEDAGFEGGMASGLSFGDAAPRAVAPVGNVDRDVWADDPRCPWCVHPYTDHDDAELRDHSNQMGVSLTVDPSDPERRSAYSALCAELARRTSGG